MPRTGFGREEVERLPVIELVTRVKLMGSKREGRDLIGAGAININGQRVKSPDLLVSRDMARFGRFVII
jgi:ribosomal protein S4